MTYHTNIRHQETVALLGSRNLYLRLVYAHIANYTQVKGAWCGSRQKLADELEIDRSVVSRKLDELITMGVITEHNDNYRAVCTTERAENTEYRAESTENRAQSTPPAPPINEIKTMEINEKNARANRRDANPENNPSFDELLKAFKAKAGNYQIADSVLEDARRMWSSDQYSDWKRRLLIRRISEGKWLKSRFDWTVSDFDPKPEFLSGIEQEDNWRANIPMVQVKVGNSYRICTLQTQQDFDLVLIQPWLKKED